MEDRVVDTNIVSYLLKGDSRTDLYAKHSADKRLCVSFMSVAELYAWAKITAMSGHPISVGDAWIAATAIRFHMPLITHNRRHFEHVPGLVLISEA